jgi:hypothetical protein
MKNKFILSFIIIGLIFVSAPVEAQVLYGSGGDLNSFVCDSLASIGLGCGVPQPVSTPVYGQSSPPQQAAIPAPTPAPQSAPQQSNQQVNIDNNLQASIANVTIKRAASDDEVILVKVFVPIENRGSSTGVRTTNGVSPTLGLDTNYAIFEIIRGQKHFIPTIDIFFDYGFDLNVVQSITREDLESFPRAKLVNVYGGGKKTYYLTEGRMIRMIPNDRIFESYGDRKEDVITISKKEFNFYPRNQYVFLENPLSPDVYQIVDDGTKRYVVPQVMKRLRIERYQIAPINKQQFDAYSNGTPIIF